MHQSVKAGSGRQSLGHMVDEIGVDNCHIRRQRIIGNRVFNMGFVIGDDCKRRHFGTGARGGRDGNHHRLFTQFGNSADTFADIHKTHGNVFKVNLRMLVHQPDDFGRVHRRTAAQSDKHVGLVRTNHGQSFVNRRQSRIRLDVKEDLIVNIHFFQNSGYIVNGAGIEQIAVGDDKGAFFAFQLAQRLIDGSAFEINFRGNPEPQHIFSPFGNGFVIQQMFDANVFADGVSAPGTAAERQRRLQLEIEQVADAALRRRRIDQQTAGRKFGGKIVDPFLRTAVGIKYRSMADASQIDKLQRHICRPVKIVGFIQRQNRRQFFMRKRIGSVGRGFFADQHFGMRGNIKPGQFGNGCRTLADDCRIDRHFFRQNDFRKLFRLVFA